MSKEQGIWQRATPELQANLGSCSSLLVISVLVKLLRAWLNGTIGPGATNVITPIQDALSDGTPLVVFTGQVSTSLSLLVLYQTTFPGIFSQNGKADSAIS